MFNVLSTTRLGTWVQHNWATALWADLTCPSTSTRINRILCTFNSCTLLGDASSLELCLVVFSVRRQ